VLSWVQIGGSSMNLVTCLCARYSCWFEPPDTLKITPGIRRMEDKSSDVYSRAVCTLVVLV
jgi:hypothetical protein